MTYRVESLTWDTAGVHLSYICGHVHRSEAAAQRCARRIVRDAARQGHFCRATVVPTRSASEQTKGVAA